MIILNPPVDIFNLICDNLNKKDLQSLSSVNEQLRSNVSQLVLDNLSAGNPILPLSKMRTIVKEDFNNKNLADIASCLIGEGASVSGATVKIPVANTKPAAFRPPSQTMYIYKYNQSLGTQASILSAKVQRSVADTKPITLQPLSQAVYIDKCNRNYRTLWTALRKSLDSLPDLQGSDAIKAWLTDPKNRAALGSITSLSIESPDFLFFPPEVKNKLTALKLFSCNNCPSLRRLDFENFTSLQDLFCYECTSLQELNLQGCSALKGFSSNDCPLLRRLNARACPTLDSFSVANCTSLRNLDVEDCPRLRYINRKNCPGLDSPLEVLFLRAIHCFNFIFPEWKIDEH
jgi:hypothetical protein